MTQISEILPDCTCRICGTGNIRIGRKLGFIFQYPVEVSCPKCGILASFMPESEIHIQRVLRDS